MTLQKRRDFMKKWICLMLALLLALPFTACGTEKAPEESTPADSPAVSDSDGETEPDAAETDPETDSGTAEAVRAHKVPTDELDFGNEEFHVYAFDWQAYSDYFFAEEESSDPLESAIYDRKRTVEEALNVKLTHTMYKSYVDMYPAVDQNIGTGDDEVQLILMHCISGVASYATSGTLYAFDKLPHVDLTADWWNREQMDALRLGKHYFYGVSDYIIPTPSAIFFNKQIIEDTGLENPYDLVHANQWTMDKMEEMARSYSRDVNNDGIWDEDDVYGIGGNPFLNIWGACDQFLVTHNEEDKLEMAINTEKAADLLTMMARWSSDHVWHYPSTGEEKDLLYLDSEQVLFCAYGLTGSKRLRESDVDYGIVPFPKYNAEQEHYRALDWGGFMAVPVTIRDPELVGATIELLSFESGNTVVPVFYDKVLDGQLAQDPVAPEMIDIVYNSICYDPGMNYLGLSGSMFKIFYLPWFDAALERKANFSSVYAEHGANAQKQIDDLYAALELTEALSDMMS